MEALSNEMIQSKPQSVVERVNEMLKNGNLTKAEREEILAVADKMKASKDTVVQETISKLENFAKQHGYTGFEAKLKKVKATEIVEPVKVEPVKQSEPVVEPVVEPVKVEPVKVEPVKQSEPVVEQKVEVKQEEVTSKYINQQISDIKDILKKGVQIGDADYLGELVKELQDKKILKKVPGVTDGHLDDNLDIKSLCKDLISRLEKVSYLLTDAEDKTKENDEKSAKEKSRKEKEDSDKKTEQEKKDISNLETGLSKLDITDIVKRINDSIEAKNHLDKSSILEEQVGFEAKQNDLKSKLDKVKLSSDNKTLSDLTGTTSVEKDEKGNLTLKFNLDPKGFDKFDSSKTYNVKLNSTNLESQKTAILGEVEKAYTEQVSDLTK